MFLKRLPTGMFSSNCYIIGQERGECAVIDPGAPVKQIMEEVSGAGMKIRYAILTHAHIDHMVSLDELRDLTGAEALVHEDDAYAFCEPMENGSAMFGRERTFRPADRALKEGDIIGAGGIELQIIHTPGHSPGCICIRTGNMLFSGDTLFRMSVGRTDLGRGNRRRLDESLEKLMKLPGDTVVYPGHGGSTTIAYEKENNPFITGGLNG